MLAVVTALCGGAAGDRGRRLGTGRPDTELGRTATAFDAMLDELETAMADLGYPGAVVRATDPAFRRQSPRCARRGSTS